MLRAIGKIFLLHQTLLLSGIDATKIVVSSSDTTVFLNHTAVFTCETRGALYGYWRVNGTAYNSLPPELRDDLDPDRETVGEHEVYTLSIPGRAEYNETVLQCVAGRDVGGGSIESANVTLKVQGLLTSVGNLKAENGLNSVTISWSAPFSLDVSGVDPDIWYTVLISNVTDEDNPTAVPCINCHNLTQTHYTFSPDLPSPCHKYTFTVIPQNGVGPGAWAYRIMGHHTKVPPGINTSEVNITVSKEGITKYSVSTTAPLLVTRTTVLCFGERPEHFRVYYESEQKHCPGFSSYVSHATMEMNNIWLINSTANLGVNCNYTLHIATSNEAGKTNSTGRLSISTTVILVNVQHWNDGLNVTCIFSNTLSEKCYVQIVTDAVSGFHEGEYLEGEDRASHSFTGLWPGTYTVLVYGMDREEVFISPLDGPDYVSLVSVGGPQETPVTTEIPMPRLGIGAGVGVVTTILVLGMAIIFIKCSLTCKKQKVISVEQKSHVQMERNMAYELHNPLSQQAVRESKTKTLPPIYEEV